jgi:hypothetical protein
MKKKEEGENTKRKQSKASKQTGEPGGCVVGMTKTSSSSSSSKE